MPWFDAGLRPGEMREVQDRVLTVANCITFVRILGLPVFAWLLLGLGNRPAAFWTLVAVGSTDWVDGYVARRFDQVTRLGRIMDPLVDRALLATVGICLLLAGILPWWVLVLIVARDVALLGTAFALFHGIPEIPVSRPGKFATACLLIGLPAFLLATFEWPGAAVLGVVAWLCTLVGIGAYYVAGVQYARIAVALRRRTRNRPDGQR